MHYHDSIYGEVALDEPVLTHLMESPALQRLHGVLQHGVTALIGITQPFTRFEHSVGAMLLVRRLGGGLEEQIGALLHDVSHTAFSHVIDYVFGDHDGQSYHEEKKAEHIERSDLPARLAAFGYDWREFIEEERFTILEQPSPALCADRLDYFLRDVVYMNLATPETIAAVLNALRVQEGRLVLPDVAVARWLAYTFIECDKLSWANFREVGLYELTARAIRLGLKRGLISEADLWTTDAALWGKLRSTGDAELEALVARVSPATRFLWDDAEPDFRVSTKLRSLDPVVQVGGGAKDLSAIDPAFARYRDEYLESRRLWPMRVLAAPVLRGR